MKISFSSSLQQVVDKSDTIFHLAANPDVVIGADNTRIDYQQNIQATYNLLEAIRKSQTAEHILTKIIKIKIKKR